MKPQRVLVIEDGPDVQRMLGTILDSAGYDVTAIDSALGAMTTVRRLRPAAILLDLGLPSRSGTALLVDPKADTCTAAVPVLVVSGNGHFLPPEWLATAAGVIAQPFDPMDLLEAVEAACGEHAAEDSLLAAEAIHEQHVGDHVRIRPKYPCHARRGESVWRAQTPTPTQTLALIEGHEPYEARLTGTVIRRCSTGGLCGADESHPHLVRYEGALSVAGATG